MYWRFSEANFLKLDQEGRIWWGTNGDNMPRLKRYLSDVKDGIVPQTLWFHGEVGHTQEAKKELLGAVEFESSNDVFITPKPTRLIERILQIATNPGDLVLDSFAGSGTTGHAVLKMNAAQEGSAGTPARLDLNGGEAATNEEADKSVRAPLDGAPLKDRRFILVEMDEKIAPNITRERVKRVAEGYTNAKGEQVPGLGGGFRYVRLGEAVFDEHGRIRESVRFADLARHVYFTETGEPLPKERISTKTPLLGIHHGRAVYLLYNGILKDRSIDGGNALCRETLAVIQEINAAHPGIKQTVVYGTSERLSPARQKREGIVFKQIPYSIRDK